VRTGWEMRVSINYALLSITNICVMLAFVCHLFACVWGLQASFDPLNTWLGTSQYCVPWSSTTNATHCHESLEHVRKDPSTAAVLCGECPSDMKCDVSEGWACVSPNRQYLYALYWSIATVTGIGYGDVVATPLHGVEQFVCVTMMLTGSLLFAYLVGSFCGLAATLSPDVVSFRQDLTDINKFMTENHIPPALRYQLREYMHQTVHLRRANTGNRLISNLAPKLRNEVALTINQRWLNVVDLLRDCEDGLKLELAYSITLQVFPPGESCPIGELYIVQRGAALFAGRAYLPGSTWGEAESLLTEPELRFPIPAVAIAYLFTYSISGDNLRATMSQEDKYPYAAEKLRRRQVTWIVRRGMVRKAEQEMCSRNERFRGRSSLYYCARNTLYQGMSSAGNQRYPGMKLANAIATNAGEMTNPTPGRACKRRATLGLHSSMDLGTPGAAAGGDSGSMAQQQSTLQRTDSCSRHGSFISETLPQINSSLVVETRFRAMQEEISTLKSSVGELRSSLDRGLGEILRRLGQGDDDGLPGAKMGSGEGDGGGVASRIGLHNLLTA
jgi:HAMP domain-containing protein